MIGVPMNPNSIYISMLQNGCYKSEFDSTYPIHLNGIIAQDEFRESIDKINRAISRRGVLICLTVIFVFSLVVGMACSVIPGLRASHSHVNGFDPLIGVGIVLSVSGSIVYIFGILIVRSRRIAQMREVIAEESMKYSSRSPTPCSWRLENTGNFVEGYRNQYNHRILHCLVIDIGRSSDPESGAFSNQFTNESTSLFGQKNNYSSPSYSGQSTGYCSQCGTIRQDLSARFCSSCGKSFNKH